MALYFITGNAHKVRDMKVTLPDIDQLDIELPELQDVDPRNIISAKLHAAFEHHPGPFMVEDTSLYFDCLNGLPGPLVKWFLQKLGNQGLYELVTKLGNPNATAKTIIGYAENRSHIQFFEGEVKGTIVAPRGTDNFGWQVIFQPEGYSKTFAEMTPEEKGTLSMRAFAAEKLKKYLQNRDG